MELYEGSIKIKFDDIPPVRLKTIIPKQNSSWLERLALATKRRFFTLDKDWFINLEKITSEPRLNGTIKIPDLDESGKKIIFDGASIPLPWLISLLTVGILRPLGVMLISSIVHDYAYKYGHLLKEDGTEIKIDRDVADRLLRDIIGTTNQLPVVGYIGWFFVRLGWIKVKYNNKPRGGKAPVIEYSLFVLVVLLFIGLGIKFSFSLILFFFVILYLAFYCISIYIS